MIIRAIFFLSIFMLLLSCSANRTGIHAGVNYSDFTKDRSSGEFGYTIGVFRENSTNDPFIYGYDFNLTNRSAYLSNFSQPVSDGLMIYDFKINQQFLEVSYLFKYRANLSDQIDIVPYLGPTLLFGWDNSEITNSVFVPTDDNSEYDIEYNDGPYGGSAGSFGINSGIRFFSEPFSIDIRYFIDIGGFDRGAGKVGFNRKWKNLAILFGYNF